MWRRWGGGRWLRGGGMLGGLVRMGVGMLLWGGGMGLRLWFGRLGVGGIGLLVGGRLGRLEWGVGLVCGFWEVLCKMFLYCIVIFS